MTAKEKNKQAEIKATTLKIICMVKSKNDSNAEKVLLQLWNKAYSAGLRDMDKMHGVIDQSNCKL